MVHKFENFVTNRKVIIYHGLGSQPSPTRNSLLTRKGFDVHADQFDYNSEWNLDMGKSLFERELSNAKSCDLIIGISFGGYLAYHLSKALGKNLIL